jgi:hypothetical protein
VVSHWRQRTNSGQGYDLHILGVLTQPRKNYYRQRQRLKLRGSSLVVAAYHFKKVLDMSLVEVQKLELGVMPFNRRPQILFIHAPTLPVPSPCRP